jgi:predicted PurR-regulated permease PerM
MENNRIINYIIGLLIGFIIYISWSILQPFISGFLLAYLCYPLKRKMNFYIKNDFISSLLVIIFIILIVIYTLFVFYEYVYNEIVDILTNIPDNTKEILTFFNIEINFNTGDFLETFNQLSFENILSKITSYVFVIIYKILKGNFNIFLEIFSFMFIMPVSTLFFLINFDYLNEFVESVFPHNLYVQITKFTDLINQVIEKFLYNQLLVILFQLFFYYVLLNNILDLNRKYFYLFVIAIGSIIPSFGSLIGLIFFVVVSFLENNFLYSGLCIFIIGYLYENYILVPILIGESLGISSFFIWCCITIGGKMLGFIGFIFAIPLGTVLYKLYLKQKEKNDNLRLNKNKIYIEEDK